MKTDEVTITITGTKKFRQEIVNIIHVAILDENLAEQTCEKNCEVKISSTLEPQWDEII